MKYFRKNLLLQCTKEIINLCRTHNAKTRIVIPQARFLNKRKSLATKYIAYSGVFLTSLLECNQHLCCIQNDVTTPIIEEDYQSKIYQILLQSKQLIKTEQFEVAKILLREALALTNSSQDFSNVTLIYDLLLGVALIEGNLIAAEDMLVRFIEQLIQIGYSDTDNKIVSYKLKLCRLYQMAGNAEMAEIGYQSCVSIQENKLSVPSDTTTHLLYLSSLFWYGRFLTQRNELQKAKGCMTKALEHEYRHSNLSILQPAQRMVLLYHSAEIVFKMGEYENATKYLMQAIDVGKNSTKENIEMPLYVVKLGVVYLYMKMYTQAENWCEMGKRMAELYQNDAAAIEADSCLEKLRRDKVIDDATAVIF